MPRSIYDPTGDLYRSLSPSPLFPPRIMGILLFCSLLGLLVFSGASSASHTWTTAVGLLFNYTFLICWAIVAVALTFWRRPLGRWSAVTLGAFVLVFGWNVFTPAGTLRPTDSFTPEGLTTLIALVAGLVLHLINWISNELE